MGKITALERKAMSTRNAAIERSSQLNHEQKALPKIFTFSLDLC